MSNIDYLSNRICKNICDLYGYEPKITFLVIFEYPRLQMLSLQSAGATFTKIHLVIAATPIVDTFVHFLMGIGGSVVIEPISEIVESVTKNPYEQEILKLNQIYDDSFSKTNILVITALFNNKLNLSEINLT